MIPPTRAATGPASRNTQGVQHGDTPRNAQCQIVCASIRQHVARETQGRALDSVQRSTIYNLRVGVNLSLADGSIF